MNITQWITVSTTIVDEDTWNTANRIIDGKKCKRLADGSYTHKLSGIIYCADCGHRLTYKSPRAQHRKDGKKRLLEVEKRLIELNKIIRKLYEDNVSGRIPERQFQSLMSDYDEEQTSLETERRGLEEMLTASKSEALRADKFVRLVRRYTEVRELDKKVLNEFIERVEVHQGVGGRFHMTQQIDVYFNFIGQFQVPATDNGISDKEGKKTE